MHLFDYPGVSPFVILYNGLLVSLGYTSYPKKVPCLQRSLGFPVVQNDDEKA